MVTVEHVESRAELAESIANVRGSIAPLVRRGHEGKHKSCPECGRVVDLHADLNWLLTCWQAAPA